MFILQELGELPKHIRGQRGEAHLLSTIDGEAFQGADDDIVVPDSGDGNLLDGHEMLECIKEFFLQVRLLFFCSVLFCRGNVQFLNCTVKQLIRYPLVGEGDLPDPAATKASSKYLEIASNSEFKS